MEGENKTTPAEQQTPEFGNDPLAPGNEELQTGTNPEPGPDETPTEPVTAKDHAPDALLHGEQPNQPEDEPGDEHAPAGAEGDE